MHLKIGWDFASSGLGWEYWIGGAEDIHRSIVWQLCLAALFVKRMARMAGEARLDGLLHSICTFCIKIH